MQYILFHISEKPDIKIFSPKPSPSHYASITKDVVFAISERLLHNYILPRDCPRVTFYRKSGTAENDLKKFMGSTQADFVIVLEDRWRQKIKETTLYCYEFPASNFELLDAGAGYYISYEAVIPISVKPIVDVFREMQTRNVEIRFIPSLQKIADEVSKSSLQFSIIRMRNTVL